MMKYLVLFGVIHIIVAYIAMIHVLEDIYIGAGKKIFYILIAICLPLIGSWYVFYKINEGEYSSSSESGNNTISSFLSEDSLDSGFDGIDIELGD